MPRVPGSESKYLVMAGWDDVPHLSARTKAELLASTPPHLRKARSRGYPALGDGQIFGTDEEIIKVAPFSIPDLWPRIGAIDFGWDHPTAMSWLAWDRDENIVYLYDTLSESKQTPAQLAPKALQRGDWIPFAWPHDGLQHGKDGGAQLSEQYRGHGLNMLHENAKFPEGHTLDGQTRVNRTSVEAGLMMMLDGFNANDPAEYARQQTLLKGEKPLRIRVFSTLSEWFNEYNMYHRKDGKIVKAHDDLLDSTRYALMMLRYAITIPSKGTGQVMRRRRGSSWV
ncbi:terminase [Comamonas koreensis]|jgi:Terminase RNaseH-like domain|uniref:phage terminase large subunit family protein n=1 Tax=Comamonas koreensis TaxID=160825 RepID=UPI0018E0A494|nr:terminase [Comamonas koreensis]